MPKEVDRPGWKSLRDRLLFMQPHYRKLHHGQNAFNDIVFFFQYGSGLHDKSPALTIQAKGCQLTS
jgi:hypothetical protein